MENQVRIVTTKRGYEHIIKSLKTSFNSEELLNEAIMGYRNAYRICVKEGNRVTMYSDESMPNEHIDLPIPVMDCKFKDEETIKKLSKFQRNKKTEVI